ncbi:hypothetical protein T310_8565, partial [Rasamsonia emersonii CBS 393.64]
RQWEMRDAPVDGSRCAYLSSHLHLSPSEKAMLDRIITLPPSAKLSTLRGRRSRSARQWSSQGRDRKGRYQQGFRMSSQNALIGVLTIDSLLVPSSSDLIHASAWAIPGNHGGGLCVLSLIRRNDRSAIPRAGLRLLNRSGRRHRQ